MNASETDRRNAKAQRIANAAITAGWTADRFGKAPVSLLVRKVRVWLPHESKPSVLTLIVAHDRLVTIEADRKLRAETLGTKSLAERITEQTADPFAGVEGRAPQ